MLSLLQSLQLEFGTAARPADPADPADQADSADSADPAARAYPHPQPPDQVLFQPAPPASAP